MISVDNDTEQVKPTEYWWKRKFMEYFIKKKKKDFMISPKSNLWLNNSIPRCIIQEK